MKVTLIGDSIRGQYAPKVAEILKNEFEVWYPNDNCRFAKYTLRGLFDWADAMKDSDIVHWNNGLWDICDLFDDGPFSTEAEYAQNILRIFDILQKRHKKIIFATTTPVRFANQYNNNDRIKKYNNLIVPLLKEKGAIINDLNSLLVDDINRYICDDNIHLSEEGIELCSKQVADYIKEAAKDLPKETFTAKKSPAQQGDGAPIII